MNRATEYLKNNVDKGTWKLLGTMIGSIILLSLAIFLLNPKPNPVDVTIKTWVNDNYPENLHMYTYNVTPARVLSHEQNKASHIVGAIQGIAYKYGSSDSIPTALRPLCRMSLQDPNIVNDVVKHKQEIYQLLDATPSYGHFARMAKDIPSMPDKVYQTEFYNNTDKENPIKTIVSFYIKNGVVEVLYIET